MNVRFLSAVVLVVAAAVYLVPKVISSSHKAPSTIILISIDTCRADFIGCYNPERRDVTPTLNALAEQATLFRHVTASVPITLPSHCTIFTGLVPPMHGVREQVGYKLPDKALTFPKLMKLAGYTIGGIVSAAVLDGGSGLAGGFDMYDDDLSGGRERGWGLERLGEDATNLAIDWLAERGPDERTFLFLHYYDPHLPYEAPPPFAGRFGGDEAGQYAAEIAYVDHCIGRLFEALKRQGIYDKAMIVVTADHGEMLGEHGEHGHQYFIYEPAIKVPLLIKMPGQTSPREVAAPVGLVDLAMTFATVIGRADMMHPGGRDLTAALIGDGDAPADLERKLYCESVVPFAEGANPLFGVSGLKWKYIESTRPELYDLQSDPAELDNVREQFPHIARKLSDEAGRIFALAVDTAATRREPSREVESTGYVTAYRDEQPLVDPNRPDAKDLIASHAAYQKAVLLHATGQKDEAVAICEEVIAERPDFLMVRIMLSREMAERGRFAEALTHCDAVLAQVETSPKEHVFRADIHEKMGNDSAALADYDAALELSPSHVEARIARARVHLRAGRVDAAEVDLRHALQHLPPEDPRRKDAETMLRDAMNDR